MSDFLAKLAGRALGFMPVAQPRGESLFAPLLSSPSEVTVTANTATTTGRSEQARLVPTPAVTLPRQQPATVQAMAKGDDRVDDWAAAREERLAPQTNVRPLAQKDHLDEAIRLPAANLLFSPQATPGRQHEQESLFDAPEVARSSVPTAASTVQTINGAPTSQPTRTVAPRDLPLDPHHPARIKPASTLSEPIHERAIHQTGLNGRHNIEPNTGASIRQSAEHASLLVPMPATVNSSVEQRAMASPQAHGGSSSITQNGRVRAVDERQTLAPAWPGNKTAEEMPSPTIQITIGRVEVRAVPQTPQQPARPAAPALSLEAYLRSQKGGSR